MTDEEMAKEIATCKIKAFETKIVDESVYRGAIEMAVYKNQQFNKVCFGFRAVLQYLGVSSEQITELLKAIVKDYTS